MIVTMTKNRMDKLNQFGGGPIPIRVKGAGKSGEFTAVMMPKNSGGMLSAAGMNGGMLSAAGQQHGGKTNWLNVISPRGNISQYGGKTNWLNVAKKASMVASPLAMLGGPQMLPVSAGLAAFAGSGKKKKAGVSKKQGKKIKKGVGLAAQISSIIAESQGYNKEADAIQRAGKKLLQIGVAVRKLRR